jgi:putative addiction module component (TIGR02574 family)
MSAATVREEALSLPTTEQARLIDELWEFLSPGEVEAREVAWAAESERRIDAHEAETPKASEAETIFAELRRNLRT